MILEQQEINSYLQDYHNGLISMGKGIGCKDFDDNLRYKQGELTIINGLDNVGKTDFMIWYALALSMKHGIKWCIYSGENKGGQLVRKLIQYMTGERVLDMEFSEVTRAELKIQQWFTFIDNSKFYKLEQLLEIFKEGNFNACLIDPFTGLDRGFSHSDNYNFLNTCRNFCENTNINIYVNTHVVTEAARKKYADNQNYLVLLPLRFFCLGRLCPSVLRPREVGAGLSSRRPRPPAGFPCPDVRGLRSGALAGTS